MTAALPPSQADAVERAAQAAERRVQLALWASGDSVWEWDAATDRVAVDRGLADDLGLTSVDEGVPMAQFIGRTHRADLPQLRQAWLLHLRGAHADIDVCFRITGADGRQRWLRARGRALGRNADGRVERVLGTLRDVTAQRQAEDSLRLMAHAFACTRDAMAVVDARWCILEINEAMVRLAGADSGLMPGTDLRHWLSGGLCALDQVSGERAWQGECALRADAGEVPVEVDITAVQASDGRRQCYLVSLHDQRERRQAEERLQRMAMVDGLTSLPNRLAAQLHIDAALQRPAPEFGVLYIDLEGFKEVNDSFGHDNGDKLLLEVGERLRSALPEDALLARWGSDEFLVMLPQGSGDTEVRAVAQVVPAALVRRFDVAGQEVRIRPTIGAVLVPRDGADFSALRRKADLAMHAAKERGNGFAYFDHSLESDGQRLVRMTSLLRIDTDRNGFHFVAQPKVDAAGHPVGAELLMRWHTDDFGAVSPVEFIPLAEKVGLIQLMGRHAAHAAAQLAAACAALGFALPVAVNLSPKQMLQPGLESMLKLACDRHGIGPEMLELELTESALLQNMDTVAPLLHRLRRRGFSLALDDFGTGYSSLSYLAELPFNKIKIDRSFVIKIEGNAKASRLLESIVRMCQSQEMRTVAEGVETPAQLAALAAMGVDEFQGYHFSRPIPVDDWLALLRGGAGQVPVLPLLPGPVASS